jgi:DNA-binding IclR family transcriptional regulator
MSRDQRGRSNMLERGIQVLQAFRPDGGTLTLPALVRRTGLPKATVYRLAEDLLDLGLLERQRHGYRPGLGLFELGELVATKSDLRETALPFLQDLYEATHETVHLGVRDGLDVIYAEKIRGHHGVDVPSRIGRRLPLTCTGVGKALLAFAGPEVLDAVLQRPLRRLTPQSLRDATLLTAELSEIRRTRLARDWEEAALGVTCVAAPIIVDGRAIAAISLTLPVTRSNHTEYGPAVQAVSFALSRILSQRDSLEPPSTREIGRA